MIIAKTLDELKPFEKGTAVTIGNFDGVHKGHQRLIKAVCDMAEKKGLASVVVTFDPHPARVLRGGKTPPFITLIEQKLELLAKLNPDVALVLEFTKEMAALAPEKFVKTYLTSGLNMKEMIVGYDYALGKGRSGNFATLTELGRKLNYHVKRLDPVVIDSAIVSSTRVRDMVEAGQVWEARNLLGRYYQIKGQVVRGMNRGGRLLGFPTANLKLVDELFPKTGVYAIYVEISGKAYQGVANIGFNPTFGNDVLSVEAHIMDFDQDIYGRDIRVHFVQRIRSEKKFNGLDELKARINQDIELGRQILSSPDSLEML